MVSQDDRGAVLPLQPEANNAVMKISYFMGRRRDWRRGGPSLGLFTVPAGFIAKHSRYAMVITINSLLNDMITLSSDAMDAASPYEDVEYHTQACFGLFQLSQYVINNIEKYV